MIARVSPINTSIKIAVMILTTVEIRRCWFSLARAALVELEMTEFIGLGWLKLFGQFLNAISRVILQFQNEKSIKLRYFSGKSESDLFTAVIKFTLATGSWH